MTSRLSNEGHLLAVVNGLRFDGRGATDLQNIPGDHWSSLLPLTDRTQLTLPLGVRCRGMLPESVRTRVDSNLASNAIRHARVLESCREITDALTRRGIEFVFLKGLSHWPYYSTDPQHRPQYDIDIYCPLSSIPAAVDSARRLRYEAVGTQDPGADHLPSMIRKTGWVWRGDYYDPEMPPSLELHFRFWDRETERFESGAAEWFWHRRVVREIEGLTIPTLDPADELSYSALHLVRHLLRGDLKLYHAYELAHFLDRSAADDEFWTRWTETRPDEEKQVPAIALRLAAEWFGCKVNPAARKAIDLLPDSIGRWFELFSHSPITSVATPNKDEIWLHFCLLGNGRERRQVLVRRLFPMRRARVVYHAHVPAPQAGTMLRINRAAYEASFMTGRALHHVRALGPVLKSAFKWWQAA